MSTAKDIVRRALRLCGVLSQGKEPVAADAEDGLERLQSLILNLPGLILNGRWREVSTATPYTARESDRITVTDSGTISLPGTINNEGCARPPRDLARVQIIGGGLWLYSATKGAWGRVDALTLDTELPFGSEDDNGLSAMLAVDLVDEFGAELTDRTVQLAKTFVGSVRSRFAKSQPVDWTRPDPLGPLDVETSGSTFCDYR